MHIVDFLKQLKLDQNVERYHLKLKNAMFPLMGKSLYWSYFLRVFRYSTIYPLFFMYIFFSLGSTRMIIQISDTVQPLNKCQCYNKYGSTRTFKRVSPHNCEFFFHIFPVGEEWMKNIGEKITYISVGIFCWKCCKIRGRKIQNSRPNNLCIRL